MLLGLAALSGRADNVKPCLIFSDASGADYAVDLERFNRISFGENSMVLTNTNDESAMIELLYTAYSRFKVGEEVPSAAIEEIDIADSRIVYSPTSRSLLIEGESRESFNLGVFNMSGALVTRGTVSVEQPFSVSGLERGVYVAVAVGEKSEISVKFIK